MTVSHTSEEYATALRESRGLLSYAARRLGVTEEAVRRRLKRSPSLQQVRLASREAMLDVAEDALFESVRLRDPWAVCFYLKTQGKERGYVERIEETRAIQGDIRIVIETVDDRRSPE